MTLLASNRPPGHPGSPGGYAVLLFDIAPSISTMLNHALHLWGYAPVELVEYSSALQWVHASSSIAITPRAAIFGMARPANWSFLQQVSTYPALIKVGIAAPESSVPSNRDIWGEWLDIILPKPFRIQELKCILVAHEMAARGPEFCL